MTSKDSDEIHVIAMQSTPNAGRLHGLLRATKRPESLNLLGFLACFVGLEANHGQRITQFMAKTPV